MISTIITIYNIFVNQYESRNVNCLHYFCMGLVLFPAIENTLTNTHFALTKLDFSFHISSFVHLPKTCHNNYPTKNWYTEEY